MTLVIIMKLLFNKCIFKFLMPVLKLHLRNPRKKERKRPDILLAILLRLSTSHSPYAASTKTTSTTRTVTEFTCSMLIPSTTLPLTWPLCHKKLRTDLHLANLQCGRRRMTFMSGLGRSRNYSLCGKKKKPTGLYFLV